ncbi:MAG: sugar ABC transporter ATP-binding protein [Solirubrobacterales bacterium]
MNTMGDTSEPKGSEASPVDAGAPASTTGAPVVEVRGLSKSFLARPVLNDFAIELLGGEVHALLGQNGSGKSTFIKILTGYHRPDAGGRMLVRREAYELPVKATDARRLGFAFVHQDLGLVPELTVLENLRIGRYETRGLWRIPWGRERRNLREHMERFGFKADPDATIRSLSHADRAIVAIVRALEELGDVEQGLLALDETTAYLSRDAVQELFVSVRRATAEGHAVLMVTHRLDEVTEFADKVTVLREGRGVATSTAAKVDQAELIHQILGRQMGQLYPEHHSEEGDAVLKVDGLTGRRIRDISFTLRRGEILGVTGLVGMGFEDLPYVLVGAEPASGSIEIHGRSIRLSSLNPGAALRQGMALLPADRALRGGVDEASGRENLTLPTLRRYMRRGRLQHRRERARAIELFHDFDVRPPAPDARFSTFSGGNQQKILVAKWFETAPEVMVLHEPTQGVDIGARQQIFAEVERASERGMAVVIASIEYEDLAHLCDRVIVVREGRQVAELPREDLSADRILERSYVA